MKILAVRGQNLASLDGPFDVALSTGVLGAAGIFAITGPTGAGKSTLLDAICLALYDTTPRLRGRSAAIVGRAGDDDRLGDRDVRGILRRGAGQGFAEVDFEDVHGVAWRARWEVQRARKRATGRLQPQELSLWRLPPLGQPEPVPGRRGEVLDAIAARVGLSFEQFGRSVLLAQGEFAAFLHADARDRAALLERVTGTWIYSRISQRVFERARAERAILSGLTDQQARLGILSEEDRQALAAFHERSVQEESAARARLQAAEASVAWHQEHARLVARLEEARAAELRTAEDLGQAAPRREALAEIRAVEPLRSILQRADDHAAAVVRTEQGLDRATAEALQAEAALAAAAAAQGPAVEAHGSAVVARDAVQPALDEASRLDAHLEGAAAQLVQARQAVDAAQTQHQAKRGEAESADRRVALLEEGLAAAEQYLAGHPESAVIAARWPQLEPALRRHVEATAEREGTSGRLAATQAEAQRAAQRWQQASQAADAAAQARQAASAALQEAEAAVPVGGREALQAARGALQARQEALAARERAAREGRQAADRVRELGAGLTDIGRRLKEVTGAEEAAEHEGRLVAGRLDEARQALALLQAARGLDDHRAALVEGEPCPLCGAVDHPWASGLPDGITGPFAQRVAELERGLKAAHEAAAAAAAEQRGLRQRQADDGRALEAAGDLVQRAGEAWSASALPPWPPAPALDDEALASAWEPAGRSLPSSPDEAAVAQALIGLGGARAALEAVERRLAAAEARVRQASTAQRKALEQEEGAAAARASAEREATLAKQQLGQAEVAHHGALARVEAALTALRESAPVGSWEADLAAAPDALGRRWRSEAEAWTEADGRRAAAVAGLQQDRPTLARLRAEAEAAGRVLAVAEQAAADVSRGLQSLRDERGALLGGEAVVVVRARLDEAVRLAAEAVERARRSLAGAREAAAASAAGVDAAQRAVEAARSASEEARAALLRRLHEAGLDEAALRLRLDRPAAWMDAEQGELDRLQREAEAAATRCGERAAVLELHQASPPPEPDAQAARLQVADAQVQVRTHGGDVHETRIRLEADAARRHEGVELGQRITAQAVVSRRWDQVNELIGAADGAKFRNFAQGLTLDHLLVHANHQLVQLARRYRLERVPGGDLDVQVIDQDMGDQVRPVTSLSGGETFLASLALALGLAQLSSETPVRSLFIDEGFGTLDRETLEVALAALDRLQAQGRQVGIISHVEGIADHVGAVVQVRRLGEGRSEVVVG